MLIVISCFSCLALVAKMDPWFEMEDDDMEEYLDQGGNAALFQILLMQAGLASGVPVRPSIPP